MCFDARTSMVAFCLGLVVSIGTTMYAVQKKDMTLALFTGGWVWVIFMQWWEYMIWIQWHPSFASKSAFVFNMMQVPLLYVLFIVPSKTSATKKIIASVIMFLYCSVMLIPHRVSPNISINKHHHLQYSWWNNYWRSLMYFIGMASMFLLLIEPLGWSMACLISLFVLLVISKIFYGRGSTPSLWCFFAVFFPLLAVLWRIFFTVK